MRNLQSYIDEAYEKDPEGAMQRYDGKTVDEAFPIVLKSQLERRLKELDTARPAMLQERSEYLSNVQQGTYVLWKEGLDLLEQFLDLNLAWGTRLIDTFNANGDPKVSHLFRALIQNQSRACLMSEEILHLLKGGFADAALARWRSLYEIAVTSTFITLKGEACADAYLDHGIVDVLKCHELERKNHKASSRSSSDGALKDLEKEYKNMLEKHGETFRTPFGWAVAALGQKNPQFKDLEENIGQEHMRVIYKLASHKIHAAANGLSSSLGIQSFGLNAPMLRAPSHERLRDPAVLCAHSLSQATVAISTLFTSAESRIEMELFGVLANQIEEAFDRMAKQNQQP